MRCAGERFREGRDGLVSSNPYQPFFEKLDAVVIDLEKQPEQYAHDAVDLLKRMGYVLANHINAQAAYLPMLILDPEPAGDPGWEDPQSDLTPGDTADTSPTDSEEG